MTVLIGIAALAVLIWMAQSYLQADPRKLAKLAKPAAGAVLLGLALLIGVRGHFEIVVPLAALGLGVLGWLPFAPAGFGARTQKSTGQVSRVRSAFLEMELDHDSGAMRGTILAGPHEGKRLESLDVATLTGLMNEIDDESRALLAA